jgi:hypothetical protein
MDKDNIVKRQYFGTFRIIGRYWKAYGGFNAFFASPYLHSAFILSILSYAYWSKQEWWNDVLTIAPSIIGFSLGGYAIWLAFGDEKFKIMLTAQEEKSDDFDDGTTSAFMALNATFAHFIVCQLIALISALMFKTIQLELLPIEAKIFLKQHAPNFAIYFYKHRMHHFFGFWTFLYSILTAFAATFAIFRVSSWLNFFMQEQPKTDTDSSTNEL